MSAIGQTRASVSAASEDARIQMLLSLVLLLPLVATAGQYWDSGFYRQTIGVEILFWPGAHWRWAIPMNVSLIMGMMGLLYLVGIGWLFHQRTLGKVVLLGIGAAIAANLVGGTVNRLTGWRELQQISSMDLAGKANRAIFSLWHNPIWEELVFRGFPLVAYLFLSKRWPQASRIGKWCYFLIPSIVFAAYHVPGHGYSRIVDTFILSLAFAWFALRYRFYAVLVLHCIFDAMMVPRLGKMNNIPQDEVRWLADHAGIFNTVQSLAILSVLALMVALFARHAWKSRLSSVNTTPEMARRGD